MSGKLLGMILIASGLIAGIALYYFQVYAFYETLELGDRDESGIVEMRVIPAGGGAAQTLDVEDFSAINSTSSPIRFRACFTLAGAMPNVAGLMAAEDPVPLNAPGWFDCFDAGRIGADLTSGVAVAVLAASNEIYGIDRVLALYPDGRGYAWQQINRCGEVVFDGRPAPEGCPPVPERASGASDE